MVKISLEGGERELRTWRETSLLRHRPVPAQMSEAASSGSWEQPRTQAHPLWPRDLGGTDKQYLTIVLVLQLLHVSPPNS